MRVSYMNRRCSKHILFAFLISTVILSACNFVPQKTKAPTQEQLFLSAMSEGLTNRNANSKDNTNMSAEETTAHLRTLVGNELDKISSFESVTFADTTFNDLAHKYINGCKRQLSSLDLTDQTQSDSEWAAGYRERAEAAIILHEKYGLVIPQEVLDYFNQGLNYTLEDFVRDANIAFKEYFEEGVDGEIELSKDGTLIYRLWIDGFSSDAYWASQGDEESVNMYTEELKELVDDFPSLQETIDNQMIIANLPSTEIELHLMNDVNRDNTISIIKKGRVVYDSALGIDMLGVGSNLQ